MKKIFVFVCLLVILGKFSEVATASEGENIDWSDWRQFVKKPGECVTEMGDTCLFCTEECATRGSASDDYLFSYSYDNEKCTCKCRDGSTEACAQRKNDT